MPTFRFLCPVPKTLPQMDDRAYMDPQAPPARTPEPQTPHSFCHVMCSLENVLRSFLAEPAEVLAHHSAWPHTPCPTFPQLCC